MRFYQPVDARQSCQLDKENQSKLVQASLVYCGLLLLSRTMSGFSFSQHPTSACKTFLTPIHLPNRTQSNDFLATKLEPESSYTQEF